MAWTIQDIPGQSGKIAVVTGANSGIGEPTARELGRAGAHVVIACRNPQKAEAALERLREAAPGASFEFIPLDLADLESVEAFADAFKAKHERLDLLVNNAGVMVPPYGKTKQGFEMQLGTNHLGHFALTGHLMGLLLATSDSRVVSLSSMAHRMGKLNFNDLQREKRYFAWEAYGQSKVACLFFTYELQRRLAATGAQCMALSSHPGWTDTNLQANSWSARTFGAILAMKPEGGAGPSLRAATDITAQGGSYYGPSGFMEISGAPKVVTSNRYSRNEEVAMRLWRVSQELTGVRFLS
jgi:NAD(P)-dependent dehydrogenase (short-subunit alcohol dehydrogenase family)